MVGLKKVYYIDKNKDKHLFKYFKTHDDAKLWIEENKETVFVKLRKGVCYDVSK